MTRALFDLFPEVIEDADEADALGKHSAFQDHPERVAGKLLVLNIRRLPSWMLSFHVWKSVRGLAPTFRRSPMLSPHEIANSSVADAFLNRYRPVEGAQIDVWLRAESIIDDFVAFVGSHTEVTPAHLEAIRALPRVNELVYDKVLDHWFTSAHIELMYLRNPAWAAIEAAIYGDAR